MKYFLTALLCFAALPTSAQPNDKPQQAVPVIITQAQPRTIADKVEALGTLRANETITLTANVTDTVSAVRFDDGQRVKTGDVLVEMTNDEETAMLREMQANVSEASRQTERLRPLVAQGAASKATLDTQNRNLQTARAQLEAVKSRLKDRLIVAPFDGVVGLRNISIGALVQPGTAITTLDDDSVMKLDFTVPALFLSTLKPGIPITAQTRAYPDMLFEGSVSSVASQIDPVTRSIVVRAIIPNEDKILKPGLLMTVTLSKNERQALVVPELALVVEGGDHYAFVVENGKAVRRKVTVGTREPGLVEITQGLTTDEKIVSDGVMKLQDGAAVTITARDDGQQPLEALLQQAQDKPDDAGEAPAE